MLKLLKDNITANEAIKYYELAKNKYSENELITRMNLLVESMAYEEYELYLESRGEKNSFIELSKTFYSHIIKFILSNYSDPMSNWINTIYTKSKLINKNKTSNLIKYFNLNIESIKTKAVNDSVKGLTLDNDYKAAKVAKEFIFPDEILTVDFIIDYKLYTKFILDNIHPKFKKHAEDVINNYFKDNKEE